MKQSLLWQIEREGSPSSFVLGTMHIKSQVAFKRITQIQQLISESEVFMAEYHLDEVKFVQQPGDLLLNDGLSLSDIIGEKKFSKIRKQILKAFSVDLSQFENYLPLLLINIIGESALSKDYEFPLDIYLWNLAKSYDLELEGAETYESQLRIMRTISVKAQIKMLREISRNTNKYRRNILRMAQWYEGEDIRNLYKYGKKSLGKYKDLLLANRNYAMVSRIEEIASRKILFFAAGAGHLAGNDGILRILKNKNWKIKAL